jgi:hypothetical protein
MTNTLTTDFTETLTVDGNGTAVSVVGPVFLSAIGNFGGGNIKFQRLTGDLTWVDILDVTSITSGADNLVQFPEGAVNNVRAVLAGSTGASVLITIQGSGRVG